MRKLFRSSKDSMIAGVCGGLGNYFNIDSTLIRLLFVLLFFIGFGAILFVYLVWIFVVPREGDVGSL
ncbi:PspC domain-containing protein [Bacillus sp. EAC]|uniref:PspC domain-containing protein n=1 Tax=Bacillus sp. EAC TaxID=1978338 RepID=UPI000B42E4D6|nr:PspC domain-containing protein [Bacillus sp. EAC]